MGSGGVGSFALAAIVLAAWPPAVVLEELPARGSNLQQIRADACRLGMAPGCAADPAYLDLLDRQVAQAERHGVYTILLAAGFPAATWGAAWDPASGWQDRFTVAWQTVWQRFRGRAAVVGYDVLDGPLPSPPVRGFVHNHLFPLYRRLHAELQKADPDKAFFFQPPARSDDGEEGLLRAANLVYAPRFRPEPGRGAERFRWFVAMAERTGASLLIGGYGGTADDERAAAVLFDSSLIGTVREPGGGEGALHLWPQRIAGRPWNFHFDFGSRQWTFEWAPAAGATLVFVPRRIYPKGFRVTLDGREAAGFPYDASTQLLTVDGVLLGKPVRLGIEPRQGAAK